MRGILIAAVALSSLLVLNSAGAQGPLDPDWVPPNERPKPWDTPPWQTQPQAPEQPRSPGITDVCGLPPLKPLPPLGCQDLVAECQCTGRPGRCSWVWRCIAR